MTGRHGERLDTWIAKVEGDELPQLRSFAAGIKRDLAAVVNGLMLPYSSGAVEGTVNRIKMLKRQMYGRAKFDLLRKRVLLAAGQPSPTSGPGPARPAVPPRAAIIWRPPSATPPPPAAWTP
jgi:hypothetical protein